MAINPKNKNRQLKCRYGITLDDYDRMYQDQNGCCKLCGLKKRLIVEHNHVTLKVRGLTCDKCNMLLGHLEDASVDFILKVNHYLYTDGDVL